MQLSSVHKKIIFLLLAILCLTPWIGPPLALLMGIIVALALGNVYDKKLINRTTSLLLKASVVGLGFGMNFNAVAQNNCPLNNVFQLSDISRPLIGEQFSYRFRRKLY